MQRGHFLDLILVGMKWSNIEMCRRDTCDDEN